MHMPGFLKRVFMSKEDQHSEDWHNNRPERAEQFRRDVDQQVAKYGLDPELPEIIRLKEMAREVVDSYGHDLSASHLSALNPHTWVHVSDEGTVFVQERYVIPAVLKPWTLAEYHIGRDKLRERCVRIVVNSSGTSLFDEDGFELVRYDAGVCDPRRMADDGRRLRNAVMIIHHHTGIPNHKELAQSLYGKYSGELKLREDGWKIDLSRDPATA